MKIGLISDLHIGPDRSTKGMPLKLSEHSLPFIGEFINHLSEDPDFAFAIHLGDLIEDAGRDTDLKNFPMGVAALAKSPVPMHHVIGNHDVINLSQKEICSFLDIDSLFYSFDAGGFHFIILHSDTHTPQKYPASIPPEQIEWLQKDLSKTTKPTILFTHFSLADQDLTPNRWFKHTPDGCLLKNRTDVRSILSSSGKIIAVLNGHLHWNHIDQHDGIPYITVQSAVEKLDGDKISNSWGIIELLENTFTLEIKGNDPITFTRNF
ncbi:MAG: metallophosphoesterase [Opitutaceae bacterium]|nr:metallophosphoesterase [Opitutaceae bacterium]